jgi:hypothetical protein
LGLFFAAYFYHFAPNLPPNNGIPHFAVSAKVLIFTYVLPQVVIWALAIYSCISLANYSVRVKGAIYKDLFRSLGIGVIIVFVCTFLAQLILISSMSVNKFNVLVAFSYVILLLGAYGFIKIYQGAEKLQKIENI